MRTLLLIFLFVSVTNLNAQWELVGGGTTSPVWDIEYVQSEDRLYAVGQMPFIGDSLRVNGTCYYENGQWYPMNTGVYNPFGGVHPPVTDILVLDTMIVVCGQFSMIDSVPDTQEFAYWQNNEWHSMGVSNSWHGSARRSVIVDDKIHVLGAVDTVNGQAMHSWAIYDGGVWSSGDTSAPFTQGYTQTLIRYQGDLIMGGNFIAPNGDIDLVRQGPNGWEKLGQGILGDPWINEMVEYDGLLWVVGEFYDFWGNAATGLLVWDGMQWSDPFPQIHAFSQGFNLELANGKLYVTMPFNVAGLSGDYFVAEYDGQQLCILGGPNSLVRTVTVSTDTLYAMRYVSGIISKWPLSAPADTCFQVSIGIDHLSQTSGSSLLVAPNPASTELRISLNSGFMQEVTLRNVQGRLVKKIVINSNTHNLDLCGFRSGLYFLSVLTDVGTVLSEKVLVE